MSVCCLKLNISYHRGLFVLSAQIGAVYLDGRLCFVLILLFKKRIRPSIVFEIRQTRVYPPLLFIIKKAVMQKIATYSKKYTNSLKM